MAQIGMLRNELVDRERWIESERFNRTLAVYQALPGPEAHELCVYFGYLSRGRIGGLLAGLGFMLPGLLLILGLAWFYVAVGLEEPIVLAFFAGAQAAVLALIVRAVHRIGAHAVTTRWLTVIAAFALVSGLVELHFALVLAIAGLSHFAVVAQLRGVAAALLLVGALAAISSAVTHPAASEAAARPSSVSTQQGAEPAELLAAGLKVGLLTFGGAYTAIPFLEADVADGGWMSRETFLDGVALAGILPAPLVIFATFVGYVAGGLGGAMAITVGVFAPAFAFTLVGHRYLERIVATPGVHAVLDGIAAAVVGLIAATTVVLVPVVVGSWASLAIATASLASLYLWRPGWIVAIVVVAAGVLGIVAAATGVL